MPVNTIVSIVSGLTFVGGGLLIENDDFMALVSEGASIEELVAFVNDNF